MLLHSHDCIDILPDQTEIFSLCFSIVKFRLKFQISLLFRSKMAYRDESNGESSSQNQNDNNNSNNAATGSAPMIAFCSTTATPSGTSVTLRGHVLPGDPSFNVDQIFQQTFPDGISSSPSNDPVSNDLIDWLIDWLGENSTGSVMGSFPDMSFAMRIQFSHKTHGHCSNMLSNQLWRDLFFSSEVDEYWTFFSDSVSPSINRLTDWVVWIILRLIHS